MGRVHCRLRLGGGTLQYNTQQYSTIAENAILRYFAGVLLCSVYILSFCTNNALKTQKNGRLLCVLLWGRATCRSCALSERPKVCIMYIICTHAKTHTHIFSHCPTFLLTQTLLPMPFLTTHKKRPTFRQSADIVADNINYFSSPIACAMYALLASLAALFASRLTFK